MASVRCNKILKNFGNVQVLKGIDLDIEDGEFVVFVGPSGCGKTTLLRIIAGLEDLTGGDLFIGQARMNNVAPKERNISMVFQNYAIYPHMTVAANIGFGMKIRGSKQDEIDVAVRGVAEILGLEDLLQRKPNQLSGGQRQRVAMGRAIVRDPSVFLMDEPLSNLDAELRNQMRVEIKSLHRRLKTTTIYVTHDQVEAMTLANRIAVMKDGEIQQFGTPDDLYSKPNNKFVAGFVGSPQMNFLTATRASEHVLSLDNGCDMKIPRRHQKTLAGMEKIEIGVRPEKIDIINGSHSASASDTVRWRTRIHLCEALGAETIVHFGSASNSIQGKVDREVEVEEGDDVELAFSSENAYFFNAETGECVGQAGKE